MINILNGIIFGYIMFYSMGYASYFDNFIVIGLMLIFCIIIKKNNYFIYKETNLNDHIELDNLALNIGILLIFITVLIVKQYILYNIDFSASFEFYIHMSLIFLYCVCLKFPNDESDKRLILYNENSSNILRSIENIFNKLQSEREYKIICGLFIIWCLSNAVIQEVLERKRIALAALQDVEKIRERGKEFNVTVA